MNARAVARVCAALALVGGLAVASPAAAQVVEPDRDCINSTVGELLGRVDFDVDGAIAVFDEDGRFMAYAPEVCMPIVAARVPRRPKPERANIELFKQAVVAIAEEDDAAAAPILEQVIAADAGFAHAYYELGAIRMRAGESAGAVLLFRQFLDHARDDDPWRKVAGEVIDRLQ